MRLEIIQKALAERAAKEADSATIAEATVHALRLLQAELDPLVGAKAVHALFARSLHLARASVGALFPPAAEPRIDILTDLHDALVSRTPADARQAGEAMLLTFADLLISLIGEPLTYRLLRSAWSLPAADKSSQEKEQ